MCYDVDVKNSAVRMCKKAGNSSCFPASLIRECLTFNYAKMIT